MKRTFLLLVFFLPTAVLLFLRLVPSTDLVFREPLLHFYVVTFTTFAAAVLSILLGINLGEIAQSRHFLAAVAFATIGIIFFSHGFATRGAIIEHSHPAVQWSAWLTLFAGGVLFVIAGRLFHKPVSQAQLQKIIRITAVLVIIYLGIATFAPAVLEEIADRSNPWHRNLIFVVTLLLWLVAIWQFGNIWRVTHSRVDGALTLVAFWLAHSTVSMHLFTTWQLSWWMYHFLLLVGFLITAVILVIEYEQARQFNLLRYYLAVALIFTALLASVVSNVFASFFYNNFVAQIETASSELVMGLTQQIIDDLPPDASPEQLQDVLAVQMAASSVGVVLMYNENGRLLYPANSTFPPFIDLNLRQTFEEALNGHSHVQVLEPGALPEIYGIETTVHSVATFAPVTLPGNGRSLIISTMRPAPELTQTVLQARRSGLGITTLSMTTLFIALFLVVRRAARIITVRTSELSLANRELRRSEGLRNDMTNMIAHDLRNPLTTILASLDFLKLSNNHASLERQNRFLDLATNASHRMMGLIDDMLTINKIEANELPLKTQQVVVADLLNEHIQAFLPQAAADQKEIVLCCPADLTASFDPALIGRVVDNLIGNALKYTFSETGKITVSASVENQWLCIQVQDNGEGVPDEYKTQIFEKYAQAPNAALSPARKGTGLGLTFCRLVVQTHQGDIAVKDAPGGGSDFVFWLPYHP